MGEGNVITSPEPSASPRVLVVAASRHGSTIQIGLLIAGVLREGGCSVDFRESGGVRDFGGYDAVVVGSAVYFGRWLPAAEEFVSDLVDKLQSMKVWVFESGPVGDPALPPGATDEGSGIAQNLGAHTIKPFAGRLNRGELNMGERALVKLTRQPYGDFRDGSEITSWARSIAAELHGPATGNSASQPSETTI